MLDVIQPVKIRIERTSEHTHEDGIITFDGRGRADPLKWANDMLAIWAKQMLPAESIGIRYEITYEDGKSYKGRYELRSTEHVLTEHITNELLLWSGQDRPKHKTPEEYMQLLDANQKRFERAQVWQRHYRYWARPF